MSPELKLEIEKIRKEFDISDSVLAQISDSFFDDMEKKTTLRMLKTYAYADTRHIVGGEYLTIDIGGSNVRICKVSIDSDSATIEKIIKFPLKGEDFDYTSSDYTLKQIITIAFGKIAPFLDNKKLYALGATISFILVLTEKMNAEITEFSKGFSLSDTLNKNIYSILSEAAEDAGINITPMIVANDCVSTLAMGRFLYPNADIALIAGTGHNSCFIDNSGEIVNIESADFYRDIPVTIYDKKYLEKIPNESNRLLGILIGGKYLSNIANEIIEYLVKENIIKECRKVTTEDLNKALNGELSEYDNEQKDAIKEIASALFKRAATLIACEIIAEVKFIDKNLERKHTIIFDGSVYEKCELLRSEIDSTIKRLLPEIAQNIDYKLVKDASSVGAAVLAACEIKI